MRILLLLQPDKMALVPYVPNGYLQTFHSAERSFTFANHSVHIRQDWVGSGVAGVVWDAAVVLATYLQTIAFSSKDGLGNPIGLRDKKILELGAGTGLTGIVACFLGGDVVITDTLKAIPCTRQNVQRNTESMTQPNNFSRELNCKVEELHWGRDLEKWQETSWDFIIGADIVYIQETFDDLLQTLKVLTNTNRQTCLLLSCRIRYQRDVDFIELLKTEFSVNEILYDSVSDVKIFQAKRLP